MNPNKNHPSHKSDLPSLFNTRQRLYTIIVTPQVFLALRPHLWRGWYSPPMFSLLPPPHNSAHCALSCLRFWLSLANRPSQKCRLSVASQSQRRIPEFRLKQSGSVLVCGVWRIALIPVGHVTRQPFSLSISLPLSVRQRQIFALRLKP